MPTDTQMGVSGTFLDKRSLGNYQVQPETGGPLGKRIFDALPLPSTCLILLPLTLSGV